MDLRDTPEEAAFRAEVRAWLDTNLPEEKRGWRGGAQRFDDAFGREWSRRLYEAGYAGLTWPKEYGGAGAPYSFQAIFYEEMATAQAPPHVGVIGLGMAGPTIMAHGTDAQKEAHLARILSAEEIWCQGFSEPDAGSDLAAARTRAERRGDVYVVNGQKVWSSFAHIADFCILVTLSDPEAARYKGLTYLIVDMRAPGVEVRPLRQITGEAEFNEVFLTDVRIPDEDRIGQVGEGWKVANATLMSERVSIGASRAFPRESGMISSAARTWRSRPELRTAGLHDRMLRLWTEAEVARLAGERLRQQLAAGKPGPEGSAAKLVFARLNQEISGFEVELASNDGLRYDDWTMRRPEHANFYGRGPGYRYLRARGNSIEGGTSEILRNIVAERVLGLPAEPRVDKDVPWKDLPR